MDANKHQKANMGEQNDHRINKLTLQNVYLEAPIMDNV